MKMTYRLFLLCTFTLFARCVIGQHSLINPLICHDKDYYLKCYYDGNILMTFGNGNFKDFKTSDNFIKYSDADKKITFIKKSLDYSSFIADTIHITLRHKSILLQKGNSFLEITSLTALPEEMHDYGIAPYTENNFVRGFTFGANDKFVRLDVSTYGNSWSWDIIMTEIHKRFAIAYNSYRKNRVEYIFIENDSLRYGISCSMTFKNLKKLSKIESSYVDTVGTLRNGTPIIGQIPFDNYFKYEYNKAGKISIANRNNKLKICDCNYLDIKNELMAFRDEL